MEVQATTHGPIETDADTIAIGVFEDEGVAHDLPGGELMALLDSGEAQRKFKRLAVTHSQGRRFILAGLIMIVANIFDFIDGKVAHILGLQSAFGAFWDSTLDRFSDLALLTGLIFLYSKLNRSDYVMIAALTLIFSIMTSYARARAESLVDKCKVGFMERPERIVLFMIGAFTNRMAAVSNSSFPIKTATLTHAKR